MSGMFITLEGLEGTGKSTNMAFVERYLLDAGVEVLLTREPGGTALGEALRDILLNRSDVQISAMSELLMIFAARAQHLEQVIRPALERGCWVVSDRFTEASYAYQGAGRQLGEGSVEVLESLVQSGLQPDLTLMLDIEPEIGLRRASKTGAPDRIEREGVEFFARVRAAYLSRAQKNSERIFLIDAAESLPQVQLQLAGMLDEVLQRRVP